MEQYIRKVRVTIGSLIVNPGLMNLHDLTVAFEVDKGISSSTNPAEIAIFNLTEGHRNALGKELQDITLECGYTPPGGGSNVGVIFKGQIRDVEHSKKDGVDIISKITCSEGEKAVRNATVSKSYEAGTKVETVIGDVAKEMEKEGVGRGAWKLPKDLKEFKRPYAVCGSCKREMDILSRGFGFYWFISKGSLEIIPADDALAGTILITPETGLVGTPTITDTGVKATALLNPALQEGASVIIESKTLEMNSKGGEYRITGLKFYGDNRDGDFHVNIVGESMKASSGGAGSVEEGKVDNLRMGYATPAQRA